MIGCVTFAVTDISAVRIPAAPPTRSGLRDKSRSLMTADALTRARLTVTITGAPLAVAVVAGDPLDRLGVIAHLRACPGIALVPPDGLDRADVVLVLAGAVGEETLSREFKHGMAAVVAIKGSGAFSLDRVLTAGAADIAPRPLATARS